MLVLEGLGGLHRTVQLHLLLHYGWVDLDYSDVECFALEMNRDLSVMFEMHPRTAFWTFFFSRSTQFIRFITGRSHMCTK